MKKRFFSFIAIVNMEAKMKKKLSLFLALTILIAVFSGTTLAQEGVLPSVYDRNIDLITSDRVEYSYSDTDKVYMFLGVEAEKVIEKDYGNFWRYRIVLPDSCDPEIAQEAIKENYAKKYSKENLLSFGDYTDPRIFAFVRNVINVEFVESVGIPNDGKPFELFGVTVQNVLASTDGMRCTFEYADEEDLVAAFDAFLNSDNVVFVGCDYIARDIYSVGDLNGDDVITKFDYILLKRNITGTFHLSSAALKRADINADSVVNMYDYLLIKRHIMGTYEIDFILKDNQ